MPRTLCLLAAMLLPFPCLGAPAFACNAGARVAVPGSATTFVRTGFQPICSVNVSAKYDQTAVGIAVAALSAKGRSIYAGGSGGGPVSATAFCAMPCTADQLDAQLTQPLAAAT